MGFACVVSHLQLVSRAMPHWGASAGLDWAPQCLLGPLSNAEREGRPSVLASHSLSSRDRAPQLLLMAQGPWRHRLVLVLGVFICDTLQVTLLWLFYWFLLEII